MEVVLYAASRIPSLTMDGLFQLLPKSARFPSTLIAIKWHMLREAHGRLNWAPSSPQQVPAEMKQNKVHCKIQLSFPIFGEHDGNDWMRMAVWLCAENGEELAIFDMLTRSDPTRPAHPVNFVTRPDRTLPDIQPDPRVDPTRVSNSGVYRRCSVLNNVSIVLYSVNNTLYCYRLIVFI